MALRQREGGAAELLRLALPLIVSNSFWTLQVLIDRVLLSRYDSDAVAASMPAVLLYWTPFALVQYTANYATTFVAQYHGAGRPRRIGPAVWQAFYFSLIAGVAFIGLRQFSGPLVAVAGHAPHVQELEVTLLNCLCFCALPALIVASAGSFFAGRGETRTIIFFNATGLIVTGLLDYAWIYGNWGFPEWGIAGAGWATVAGDAASALLALTLMFRRKYREEFATLSGWRFDPELFRRLLRFGLPNGLQIALDCMSFALFVLLVGRLGDSELAATSIAFTINMVAIIPILGVGQSVSVLVGQRLGQDRPEIAERTTWTGFRVTLAYMTMAAVLFVAVPDLLLSVFQGDVTEPSQQEHMAAIVPILLRFVAVYSLFDAINLVFSFALRGAGDTRFVSMLSLVLSWPLMVVPTYLAWKYGWGLYWAWTFASSYIIALALAFFLRFRGGKWKSMRVIESAASPQPLPAEPCELVETA